MTSAYSCTPRTARQFIREIMESGLVPYLRASPGTGKSSLFKGVAKDFGLDLIDHRLSTSQPEDLSGYPKLNEKATFVPYDIFPTEAHDELRPGSEGWLLFFDEFNSANKQIQAATYRTILDREVGQYKLHERVFIGLAGNLDTDRAITHTISTALQSRVITLDMQVSFNEWLEDVAIPNKYNPAIIAYLSNKPSALMDFRPDHNDKTFCSPRTWEFMNRLLQVYPAEDSRLPLYAGTISSGEAISFLAFTKIQNEIASVDDILRDPANTPIPQENGKKYLIVSFLAAATNAKNFDKAVEYISRLPSDFQVLYFRTVRHSAPELETHPAFRKAMLSISRYLNE